MKRSLEALGISQGKAKIKSKENTIAKRKKKKKKIRRRRSRRGKELHSTKREISFSSNIAY